MVWRDCGSFSEIEIDTLWGKVSRDMDNTNQKRSEHGQCVNEEKVAKDVDRAKYVYELVNGWIMNADAKVEVSCGLFTGVFGVMSFLSECVIFKNDSVNPVAINELWSNVHRVFLVGGTVLLFAALIFYALSIVPNLKSSATRRGEKPFLLFYGDIADTSLVEFRKVLHKACDVDFLDEIMSEAYHNAGICRKKMRRYKAAVFFSIAAILFALGGWITNALIYT